MITADACADGDPAMLAVNEFVPPVTPLTWNVTTSTLDIITTFVGDTMNTFESSLARLTLSSAPDCDIGR